MVESRWRRARGGGSSEVTQGTVHAKMLTLKSANCSEPTRATSWILLKYYLILGFEIPSFLFKRRYELAVGFEPTRTYLCHKRSIENPPLFFKKGETMNTEN